MAASFNFDKVTESLGSKVSQLEQKLGSETSSLDQNNPADLIKMQQSLTEWSVATQLQSSVIKTIGDALRGIVQKVG